MSATNQSNGKKSSNSSVVNTPASTPVTHSNGNSALIHNSPPPNNNAPKYGTVVPNRIFVGGISAHTTEGELLQLFSNYGTVKAAKIIQDRAGVSKGYGFITFETEDDAKRPLREADNIMLRERKLNVAPAIKKQPFNRAFDGSSPPTVAPGNPTPYFFNPAGPMPYFQGGVAYYAQPNGPPPGDNAQQAAAVYQPPPVYPPQTGPPQAATYPSMMFPAPSIYMPQQYPMPMPYEYNYYPNNGAPPQYMVSGGQSGPGGMSQGPHLPPSGSPPRPPAPCYTQQLQYPPEPIYYNMPMYGNPMDPTGPPVYADTMEPSPNPYNEDGTPVGYDTQDLVEAVMMAPPTQMSPLGVVDLQHHKPIEYTSPSDIISTNLHHQSAQTTDTNNASSVTLDVDTTRQTHTPVVSLRSFDQQQEKDITSMKGGRRKKLPDVAAPPSVTPPTFNGFAPHNAMFPPPPPPLNHFTPPHTAHFRYNNVPSTNGPPPHVPFVTQDYKYQRQPPPATYYNNNNGYNNRNKPRRNLSATYSNPPSQQRERPRSYNNDYSSRSSVRTDSNSSASVVDENRNEEKLRTNVATPPPTAYSPLNNQSYGMPPPPSMRSYQGPQLRQQRPQFNGGRGRSEEYHRLPPKGGLIFDSSAQVQQASFAQPMRNRNRRTVRRNPSGVTPSEIGAGDAPIPNADVSDACKKMETLKL